MYPLGQFEALFRGSSLTAQLIVNQPHYAMQGDDAQNVWRLELRGDGEYPGSAVEMSMPFSETLVTKGPFNPEDFGRNVAVVGKLDNFAVWPTTFLRSQEITQGDVSIIRRVHF